MHSTTAEQIQRAARGDRHAVRDLIAQLMPVIRAAIARTLIRAGAVARRGDIDPDIEDMTQEVLTRLFADQARALVEFRPECGPSLPAYVGLIAQREAISRLRSRSRSPLTECLEPCELFDRLTANTLSADQDVSARQLAERLLLRMRAELSPCGARVLEAMHEDDVPLDALGRELGISVDAVYAWRCRIRSLGKRLFAELDGSVHNEPLAIGA